jgi:hypothetical protein
MRVLILLTIVLFGFNGFSQTEFNKTIFNKAVSGETVKVIFNVSNYNPNVIGEFKDEFDEFKGKVLIAHYDEKSSLFTIVYNEHMIIETLIKIFDRHNISYLKENSNPQLQNN